MNDVRVPGMLARMLKGMLVGVVVGFAAGWLLFVGPEPLPGADEETAATARVLDPPPDASPALATAARLAEERVPPGAQAPPVSDLATLDAGEMHVRWNAHRSDRPIETDEVLALIERAREARRAGDAATFAAALRGLSLAPGETSDRFLLETLGDVTLPLPRGVHGGYWLAGLRDSSVPGIAGAARARLESQPEYAGADDLLTLVALHGNEEEVDGLRSLLGKGRRLRTQDFVEALAKGAANPPSLRAYERMLREQRRHADRHWHDVLRANPSEGSALLAGQIDESMARSDEVRLRTLLHVQARFGADEAMAPVHARIARAMTEAEVLDALRLVDTIRSRGKDASGGERLVEAALGVVRQGDARSRRRALGALQSARRVAWTPQVLAALERAAPDAQWLPELRAHLASPWKDE